MGGYQLWTGDTFYVSYLLDAGLNLHETIILRRYWMKKFSWILLAVFIVSIFAVAFDKKEVMAAEEVKTFVVATDATWPPMEMVNENKEIVGFDIDFLKAYPTVGPGGSSKLDINGLAGSLELYLGKDVLIDTDTGDLTFVQWKGYNKQLKKYQGEVMQKPKIQAKFFKKVEKCKSDLKAMESADWVGLKAIFNCMFNAFD